MSSQREHWRSVLAPAIPWQDAYPRVASSVKALLAGVTPASALSTVEVVERLWPQAEIHDEADEMARARIFRALRAMIARDLKDYNRPGEAKKSFRGRTIVPRLWAEYMPANVVQKTCPHCGGAL